MKPPDMSGISPTESASTAGIDLASQPRDTAVCVIDWGGEAEAAQIVSWSAGWSDDKLAALMSDPTVSRVGIDSPFGWPIEYVNAISAYRDFGIWPVADEQTLRFRATERQLGAGLSPSLDNLVWIVLRCARLLDRWARENSTGFDRTGVGRFVEVYPAAALSRWGVSPAEAENPGSYKGDKPESVARRGVLVSELSRELEPAVVLPKEFVDGCEGPGGDHVVDALVAALVARAMELDRCDEIPSGSRNRAEVEGWIRLPIGPLRDDIAGPRSG